MLKIKDKEGRTKFILKDEDEEPVSIDELIIEENEKRNKKFNKKQNKGGKECQNGKM